MMALLLLVLLMLVLQVRVSFILVTAIYNLGHIFYLWFLLITSGSPFTFPFFMIRMMILFC